MDEAPKTPRGAEYKKRYPESAKEKLVIPRDAEGNPNWEVFPLARNLDARLQKYVWYVGIAPNGSRMKGYSTPESDADMIILIDESKFKPEISAPNIRRFIDSQISSELSESKSTYDIEIEPHECDVSRDALTHFIAAPEEYIWLWGPWYLFGPVKGERVAEYRRLFRSLFPSDDEERKETVAAIARRCVHSEIMREEDLKYRLGALTVSGIENGEWSDFFKERQEYWRKRIEKVLDS